MVLINPAGSGVPQTPSSNVNGSERLTGAAKVREDQAAENRQEAKINEEQQAQGQGDDLTVAANSVSETNSSENINPDSPRGSLLDVVA